MVATVMRDPSVKVDEKINMGLIKEVKEKLREVNVLKIMYVTDKASVLE